MEFLLKLEDVEDAGLDLSPLLPVGELELETVEGGRLEEGEDRFKEETDSCSIPYYDVADIFCSSAPRPAVFLVTCPSLPEETSQSSPSQAALPAQSPDAADLLLKPQVGPLPLEVRKAKIEKYRRKRDRRRFKKIVEYQCRKKVADGRVRVKGRFVTKKQEEALKEAKI